MEQSFEADYWSEVESDFGVAKVERSCDVSVCIPVCVYSAPKLHSIEYVVPIICPKCFLEKINFQKNPYNKKTCSVS